MTRRNESLSRVIAHALKERTELTEAELEAAALRAGINLPRKLVAEEPPVEDAGITLPVPPHDREVVYAKALTCPACGAAFSTLVVHARKDQPAERSSDFHQRYETSCNPYDYKLWVCPNDLYAALPADFLREASPARLAAILHRLAWCAPPFGVVRSRTGRLRRRGSLALGGTRSLYRRLHGV